MKSEPCGCNSNSNKSTKQTTQQQVYKIMHDYWVGGWVMKTPNVSHE